MLAVADLSGAIARAEAILRDVRQVGRARVAHGDSARAEEGTGPSGTQRIAALTKAEAERVLRSDAIIVLDEYAFKYPAGRLDTFLLPDVASPPARAVARHALIGWIAFAFFLPAVCTELYVVGMGR